MRFSPWSIRVAIAREHSSNWFATVENTVFALASKDETGGHIATWRFMCEMAWRRRPIRMQVRV